MHTARPDLKFVWTQKACFQRGCSRGEKQGGARSNRGVPAHGRAAVMRRGYGKKRRLGTPYKPKKNEGFISQSAPYSFSAASRIHSPPTFGASGVKQQRLAGKGFIGVSSVRARRRPLLRRAGASFRGLGGRPPPRESHQWLGERPPNHSTLGEPCEAAAPCQPGAGDLCVYGQQHSLQPPMRMSDLSYTRPSRTEREAHSAVRARLDLLHGLDAPAAPAVRIRA